LLILNRVNAVRSGLAAELVFSHHYDWISQSRAVCLVYTAHTIQILTVRFWSVCVFNLRHIHTDLGACIYCNIDCSLSVSIEEFDDDYSKQTRSATNKINGKNIVL